MLQFFFSFFALHPKDRLLWITNAYVTAGCFYTWHFKNKIWIQFNYKTGCGSWRRHSSLSLNKKSCQVGGRWILQKLDCRERERKRGDVCPCLCVVMCGKEPDKKHADPQSWLPSSPDKSALRHSAMCPRAGSTEAAELGRTQSPRTNSGPPLKTKGDPPLHGTLLQSARDVFMNLDCAFLG